MLAAQQQGQQVVRDGVVTDQLGSGLLGGKDHVDGGGVVALLGIRAGQVQADLAAAATEPGWKVLQIQRLAGLHGGAGVTERDGCGDLVDADVRRPERGPVVVAVLAEPLSDPPRCGEGPVSGGTVEAGRGGEHVREVEAAQDGQPFRVAVRGGALDGAGRAGHQVARPGRCACGG